MFLGKRMRFGCLLGRSLHRHHLCDIGQIKGDNLGIVHRLGLIPTMCLQHSINVELGAELDVVLCLEYVDSIVLLVNPLVRNISITQIRPPPAKFETLIAWYFRSHNISGYGRPRVTNICEKIAKAINETSRTVSKIVISKRI